MTKPYEAQPANNPRYTRKTNEDNPRKRVAAALYNDMHRNEFWDERGEELHPILSFSEYAAFAPGVHRGSSPAPPFSTYRRLVLAPAGSERPTGRRCPFTAAGSAGASANA